MLPIQKSNQINQRLVKALERLGSLNVSRETFFTYVTIMNTLENAHAKVIWNSMTQFQDQIFKLTFYSSQKVKRILNFTKIFREFSLHWERISKVNIKNLEQLSSCQIESSQKIVKQKANNFLQQLSGYFSQQKNYNSLYTVYLTMCSGLKEDIEKFKSYSDPLCFYNQKFTSQFLEKLKKKFDSCNILQSKLKTQTQMLDQKRLYLSQNLSEVKQAYVPTFQKNLKTLYLGIKYIIDPSKDEAIHKQDFKLRKNDIQEQKFYAGQVQNLLGSRSNRNQQDDQNANILNDFQQLFKNNQVLRMEITSDQKFFYDRCQTIKTKKIKRSNQILSIQKLLINQFKTQIINLKHFQTQFKKNEKLIFGSDGEQTYSKKFRKYFGKNFHQLYQLCLLITEKRRSSIQKIYKVIENCQQKLSNTFKEKKSKLNFFENKVNYVLQNHKKIKSKAQNSNFPTNQIILQYKASVTSSYEDFSKKYKQLQIHQNQMDKMFFKSLQQISDLILKQAINKSLTKIIQKQKNRMEIFRQIQLATQAQTNFYQDVKYEIFFSQQIQQNLSKNFKSEINQKQFQQTKNTLQQKECTLNGMIKHKITCCGVKSKPLTKNIKKSLQCYLINMKTNKSKIFGSLNILTNGVSFSQKSRNPFTSLLRIIIPNKDIDNYKTEVIEQTSVLTISTKKGPVYFFGSQISLIFDFMLQNLGVKNLQKQSRDKNARNQSSSSSFLGSSASRSFRIHFEKSTSPSINRMDNVTPTLMHPLTKKLAKSNSQTYTMIQILKKVELKLISEQFISQRFTPIQNQLSVKDDSRFNYNYRNGIHKFLLKERKRSQITSKVLSFDYTWKISFPQNVMLKSFKHYETVYVQLLKNEVKIKIIHGVNSRNVLLAQKVFYDQIADMNQRLFDFIINFTERPGEIFIEPDQQQSLDSLLSINPDDIMVNFQGQKSNNKFYRGSSVNQNFNKNLKVDKYEKSQSNYTVTNYKS